MKTLTLAFLFRADKILLGMKKEGFGTGKWNGYGGKLEQGEKPIDGIVREIQEESGLIVEKDACKELGYMDFYFNDMPEWNQRVIVYRVDEFAGEPRETDEMMPKWFKVDEIPYGTMWKGDEEWIPYVIKKEPFTGEVHFDEKGTKVVKSSIN